jgi:hypothetical protein
VFIAPLAEAAFSANLDKLGVAMFGIVFDGHVDGIVGLEKKFGFQLPKIFPPPLNTNFSDPKRYPLFNRVGISNYEYGISMADVFKRFGWSR